jgi:hypothetical protein
VDVVGMGVGCSVVEEIFGTELRNMEYAGLREGGPRASVSAWTSLRLHTAYAMYVACARIADVAYAGLIADVLIAAVAPS